jgi:hypothetical protein
MCYPPVVAGDLHQSISGGPSATRLFRVATAIAGEDPLHDEKPPVRNTFQFAPGDLASMLPNQGAAVVSLHKDD